jgi:hypothetical protein
MHAGAWAYVARTIGRYPVARGALVVELGARNVNGSIRSLFAPVAGLRYLGTDIAPGPGVDVVTPGESLTLEAPADVVVCCEVLEHTSAAPAIVGRARDPDDGGAWAGAAFGRGRRADQARRVLPERLDA